MLSHNPLIEFTDLRLRISHPRRWRFPQGTGGSATMNSRSADHGAMASGKDQPQVWRIHRNRNAHERARPGCTVDEGDAAEMARSKEKAPPPRIIRKTVKAITSRWNSKPSPL